MSQGNEVYAVYRRYGVEHREECKSLKAAQRFLYDGEQNQELTSIRIDNCTGQTLVTREGCWRWQLEHSMKRLGV